MNKIEIEAAKLAKANAVKYRAMGCTHRLELRIYNTKGFSKIVVLYLKKAPTLDRIAAIFAERKSKRADDYILSEI